MGLIREKPEIPKEEAELRRARHMETITQGEVVEGVSERYLKPLNNK